MFMYENVISDLFRLINRKSFLWNNFRNTLHYSWFGGDCARSPLDANCIIPSMCNSDPQATAANAPHMNSNYESNYVC